MRMLFSLVSVPLHLVLEAVMNVLPPPASSNHCDERGDDDCVKSQRWTSTFLFPAPQKEIITEKTIEVPF